METGNAGPTGLTCSGDDSEVSVGLPLSTALKPETKPVTWLPRAMPGHATLLDFAFSGAAESGTRIMAESTGRTIVNYTDLPNGEAFVVTWMHHQWNGESFRVPDIGEQGQYVISKHDPMNSGRPGRFTLFLEPNKNRPIMLVDEFGAYPAPMDLQFSEPMGCFSREKVVKRGKLK